ncbi:MAG TPA: hypothetical protein VH092_03135, partial [Urbifossiella sp.]|nr:hypothetical protein [Urbifossiella sp.]
LGLVGPTPVLFWSRAGAEALNRKDGIDGRSRLRRRIQEAARAANGGGFVYVRLDDTAWPGPGPPPPVRADVDSRGARDPTRVDREHTVWWATVQVVAALRGVVPLRPSLEFVLDGGGRPVQRDGYRFFAHTALGGAGGGRQGAEYVESLEVVHPDGHAGLKVPAAGYGDGTYGYRFSVPDNVTRGYWWSALSFGLGYGWRTVDLSGYRELRFNARADGPCRPIAVSLTDNDQQALTPHRHNETGPMRFEVDTLWRPGSPFIVPLGELDWSIDGFPGNQGPVNRREVLQVAVSPYLRPWPPGRRWLEVKDMVFI